MGTKMKNIVLLLMLLSSFILGQGMGQEALARAFNASSNAFDVQLGDQTSSPLIAKFNKIGESTIINDTTVIDAYTIVVDDTTGVANYPNIAMFDPTSNNLFLATVLSANDSVLTVDTPLDYAFLPGSYLDFTSVNMAVNGLVTPQIFGLRGVSPVPIGQSFDITRLKIVIVTTDVPEATEFGDIVGGLTKGLVLRKRNGVYNNYFNVKTNMELASISDRLDEYDESKSFNVNALVSTLTFAGQGNIGVAIRLDPGEDLEFIVQDTLSSLVQFYTVAEGHIVEN